MKDRSWLVVFILSLTVAISLAEYAWTGSQWEWRETKTRSRPDDDDSEQGSGGGLGSDDEDNYEDDSDDSASPWKPRTAPAGPVHNLRLFASQLSKDNKVLPLQRSLRVTWSPPDKEKWNGCLLSYAVGYKRTNQDEVYVFEQIEGNYTRRGDDKPLYFNEEEGAEHAHIIGGLEPHTEYTVTIRVSNPWGRFESLIIDEVTEFTEQEACTLAPLPDAETFVKVAGLTLTLHLQNWKGGNCPDFANFAIYMDESNEWDLLEAHARDPEFKLPSMHWDRVPGAVYRIKVIRKSLHYVSDEVYEYSTYDFKESEARYEISTLPGSSPGCIIELGVKYSGNNLISKVDIDQEGCATLCLAEAKCTHWTYNPTRRKCWLKTSSQGRAASTKGSNSGQKACGVWETETVPESSKVNKANNSTICLLCIPACKIEEKVKFSGSNLYNEQGITQATCAELCFREPKCHFWTHNAKRTVSKCWLKTDDKGRAASTKGSVSGQKSCGVTGSDISSGLALQDGCECEPACTIEENVKFGGHNVYNKKGIKGGKGAPGCAALCYRDPKCHFWTYNGQARKCWLKKSDKGRAPSTKGSISGQKACGEESALALFSPAKEPEMLVIAGGDGEGSSLAVNVTVWPSNPSCNLPSLPSPSISGFGSLLLDQQQQLTFLGKQPTPKGTAGPLDGHMCLALVNTTWEGSCSQRVHRAGAMFASTSDGILVLGGVKHWDPEIEDYLQSTEIIMPAPGVKPGLRFEMKMTRRHGCLVLDGEAMVVTGGETVEGRRKFSTPSVSRFTMLGPGRAGGLKWELMEDMQQARAGHACGLVNYGGTKALVVAGGFFWEPYGVLDTTEMLVLSGPGHRSAWTFMDPLPSPRFYSAGAVLGGSFILSGGHSANWPDKLDEMLELELPSKSWKALEAMGEVRAKHGMVAVPYDSIKQFCQN